MEIFLQNTKSGLVPLYDSDLSEKKKLKLGTVYKAKIIETRDYIFLKRFMALIRIGKENSKNVEMPFDAYRKYATIKAGYADIYHTPKGLFVDAKSIAFDKMSESEFREVYSNVLNFIIKDIEADREIIEKELINFL